MLQTDGDGHVTIYIQREWEREHSALLHKNGQEGIGEMS